MWRGRRSRPISPTTSRDISHADTAQGSRSTGEAPTPGTGPGRRGRSSSRCSKRKRSPTRTSPISTGSDRRPAAGAPIPSGSFRATSGCACPVPIARSTGTRWACRSPGTSRTRVSRGRGCGGRARRSSSTGSRSSRDATSRSTPSSRDRRFRCAACLAREGQRICDLVRDTTAARYREFYTFTYADPSSVLVGAAGARARDLPPGRPSRAAPPAPIGLRRLLRQERRPRRLHRGARLLRAARDRLQHLLRVPGRGVRLDLRPRPEAPPRRPRRDVLFDRPVPARVRERGGDRVGRLLVLSEARLSADRRRGRRARRARRAADEGGSGVPVVEEDARRPRHAQPPVRGAGDVARGTGTGSTSATSGLAVSRRMAREFGGDAERLRASCERRVAGLLGVRERGLSALERKAFADFALVLDVIPDLARWTKAEREGARRDRPRQGGPFGAPVPPAPAAARPAAPGPDRARIAPLFGSLTPPCNRLVTLCAGSR